MNQLGSSKLMNKRYQEKTAKSIIWTNSYLL